MTATLKRRKSASLWSRFYDWVTSTENHLCSRWFGVLMIPTLLIATSIFIITFIAAPPVDIDGIHKPIFGFLLYGNNIIPILATINLHSTQSGKQLLSMNGYIMVVPTN
jgi:photosystem II P680 reaction center D1 protein